MRCVIVGDIHFSATSPSSRIDDYPNTIIEKMNWIRQYCSLNGIQDVFLLGDVFHTVNQPTKYVNKIVDLFYSFKRKGITVYTIIGNHDVPKEKIDLVEDTPLGTLLNAGLVLHLKKEHFLVPTVVGVDYGKRPEKAENNTSILLGHHFYNNPFGKEHDNITKEDVASLGYRMVILGHDHNVYPVEDVNGCKVVRFGALSRGTSHYHHLLRSIQILDLNLETFRFKTVEVPHLPSDKVFANEALEKYKKETSVTLSSFRETLSNLVHQLSVSEEESDVVDSINQMNLEPEVSMIVKDYLRSVGVTV